MQSLESKVTQQLSLFGLPETDRMKKQPSLVSRELDEIACPTKEVLYYD